MQKKQRDGKLRRRTPAVPWAKLNRADLDAWAGVRAVTRGRRYEREGRVQELGISSAGELLAWVQGDTRYATRVLLEGGSKGGRRIVSRCSCPVTRGCKHAVAVVVALLNALEANESVSRAGADDVRWDLATGATDVAREAGDAPTGPGLEPYLRSLRKNELVKLVLEVSAMHPGFESDFVHKCALARGDADGIARQVRAEIASTAAQEVRGRRWSGEGEQPDYSRVESGFTSLFERAQYDELLELGRELFEVGGPQVERYDEDGMLSCEIAECMRIVFRALTKSSLSDPQKLLYALDLDLADDFELAPDARRIIDRRWSKRTWSAVADALAERLAPDACSATPGSGSRSCRDRLSGRLAQALDAAGRADEADAVCEAEALRSGSYGEYVRRLIEAKRLDDATRWAVRGYAELLETQPGSASLLREQLIDIARRRRRWPIVAAFEAEKFFERPGAPAFGRLLAAAEKAGCAPDVRKLALRFLETGKRRSPTGKWPLPATGLRPNGVPHARNAENYWGVLRDIAIAEERPEDVLRWHDRLRGTGRRRAMRASATDLAVARAVAATRPDRAIELFSAAAEQLIARAKPDAYAGAGELLERVRDLMRSSNRSREWPMLVDRIRTEHRRKRRLMEVLDGLDATPLVRAKPKTRARTRRRS